MEIEQEQKMFSFLDQFKIIKSLGSGYHAQVKLGVDKDGNYVAIKRYKKETANLKTLKHELEIIKQLNHQNIVKLIDFRQKATYRSKRQKTFECLAIILEYVGGGQLFDYIAETGKFSQKITRTYFHHMMNGLYYIHSKGYAHRDIKPQNVLLSREFILKLADFGYSCLLKGKDGSGVLHTELGTPGYMAPQISKNNYDGAKVDIFAAGVILFIMYAGAPPFENTVDHDPYFKLIKSKNYKVFWQYHSKRRSLNYFSEKFRDLFQKMVSYNPNQRISIIQISKHPWVIDQDSTATYNQVKQQFTKRQKKLDQIMDTKALQEQKKKNQIYQQMKKNQNKSRRGQSNSNDEFIQFLLNQKIKKRKLNIIEPQSKQDFIIKEELPYLISNLKVYFTKCQILLEEINQDVSINKSQIPILKVSKVKDLNQDKIRLLYSYNYGDQDDQTQQTIEITLTFGQCKNSENIVIHFNRQSGNQLYYKMIARQIKNLFAYCLVKQKIY